MSLTPRPVRRPRPVRLVLSALLAAVALTAMNAVPAFAMQISIVVTGKGMQLTLDVEPSDSIENVKAKITDAAGYPAADQTLTYNGETLDDGRTLADYNIVKEAVLTLTLAGQPPTPPTPPTSLDSDRDGLSDEAERALGTDPARPDTDGDGLTDGVEVTGIVIRSKVRLRGRAFTAIGRVRTDPLSADTDRDGLTDRAEVRGRTITTRVRTRSKVYVIGFVRTDPTRADTDRDGLRDRAEIRGAANARHGRKASNPLDWDTDRGGASDGRETRKRTDPTVAGR